ncbi:MAG: restriction endonuclease [Pirellulaceae bacterium]|nr:restriction endonuclease [Pirellulaceae bacterium]
MAIPNFQSLTLPLLQLAADGVERSMVDTRALLAEQFSLTNEEIAELLPSGQQPRFTNRVAWAKVYLERAGLLSKTRRGHFKITDRGLSVLAAPPDRIDINFLKRFSEFGSFRSRQATDGDAGTIDDSTPEEILQAAYQTIRDSLSTEILTIVKSLSASFFEHLVLDLMLKMGYGGSRDDSGFVTSLVADEGIDGIINEDQLGLDVIYLQAKRWENTVGRPEIQRFVGALHGRRARKGVFLTTSSFSQEARDYVATIDAKVVLIDGLKLAQLMIDFNVGVGKSQVYEIKRIDSDYFADE